MKTLKPHQIGIILALLIAAALAFMNIWGQASGMHLNRDKVEARP